ncbi:hypothetical protein [Kribbella sp. NPDC023855]|uniref:hypothetical protein n=1 Tax=Kribbella sp. NPDC023855 TaxID=3154698 RepID=UPI0033D07753
MVRGEPPDEPDSVVTGEPPDEPGSVVTARSLDESGSVGSGRASGVLGFVGADRMGGGSLRPAGVHARLGTWHAGRAERSLTDDRGCPGFRT